MKVVHLFSVEETMSMLDDPNERDYLDRVGTVAA